MSGRPFAPAGSAYCAAHLVSSFAFNPVPPPSRCFPWLLGLFLWLYFTSSTTLSYSFILAVILAGEKLGFRHCTAGAWNSAYLACEPWCLDFFPLVDPLILCDCVCV